MAALKFSLLLLVSAAFSSVTSQMPSPPRLNGSPADTMRRFPHHVTIQPIVSNECSTKLPFCGGSILSYLWILTSMKCVDQGDQIRIDFQKLHSNSSEKSYSALVNNDDESVFRHPTEYFDIALLRMSMQITYSSTVRPISISTRSLPEPKRTLTVLPGFDSKPAGYNSRASQDDKLTYAMMDLVSNDKCQQVYGDQYDEYLQLCSVSWTNYDTTPCINDHGSGLIIGWPTKPEIVGIFSTMSGRCSTGLPSVYTNVAKFRSWINSVTGMYQYPTTPTIGYYTNTPPTAAPAPV